jgi:hypothetical protein
MQEMSDARQSAQAAIDAGADHYLPGAVERVNALLAAAEQRLAVADYPGAAQQAIAAKTEAVQARALALAFVSATEAVARARRAAVLGPNTMAVLQQAMEAGLRGEEALAAVLVEQAQHEVDQALEEYDLERARRLAKSLRSQPVRSPALREALGAAEVAIRHHQGHRAYGLLAPYATP